MGLKKRNSHNVRVSNNLQKLINDVKIEYLKQNKKPPTASIITDIIIKKYKITKEDLLYNEFINFK